MEGTALLSKKEAKRILRLSHFPECDLSNIWTLEFDLFDMKPLSKEIWEALLEDVIDYSLSKAYKAGTYAKDSIRTYKDETYVSLVDNNIWEPNCKDKWAIADKFETSCYNDFWVKYGLGEYLSRKLLLDSLAENVVNLTGNGLVVKRGMADFSPAGEDDRSSYVSAQIIKINRCLKRMNGYLRGDGIECFSSLEEVGSCSSILTEDQDIPGQWEMS